MIKTELIELLKDMADDAEVNETIQGIEGLTKTFDFKTIGLDDFKNVLETNDIAKTYFQSSVDSGVGKGVTAYKENFTKNELPKLVEEAIKAKSNEGKSEAEIKLDEALAKIAEMENKNALSEMKAKYTKVLSDKGVKPDLIDFLKLNIENDEENNSTIEKVVEYINSSIAEGVKSKFGNNAYTPPSQDNNNEDSLLAQLNAVMGVK